MVITKKKPDTIGLGRTLVRPEGEFSCANEKVSLLDRQQKVIELTLAVFEIVPYSVTHYFLYSVHDIVHYIGSEQTRIRTLR